MTEPTSVNPIKALIQKEPILASYAATWLLTNAGEFVLGHTHLINSAEWSTVTTSVAPVITTAILGGLAYVTRKFVVPVVKKIDPNIDL